MTEFEKKIAEQEEIIKKLEDRCGWLQDEWEETERKVKMWQDYTSFDEVKATYQENITLKYKLERLNKEWKVIAYDLERKVEALEFKMKHQADIFNEKEKEWTQTLHQCSQCHPDERKIVSTWDQRYGAGDQLTSEQYESLISDSSEGEV